MIEESCQFNASVSFDANSLPLHFESVIGGSQKRLGHSEDKMCQSSTERLSFNQNTASHFTYYSNKTHEE